MLLPCSDPADGRLCGRHHLLKAVLDFGGFPTVVERIAKDLGIDMRTRRRAGHWDDISNVVKEMREFMKQQSEEGEEPQLLPTHR